MGLHHQNNHGRVFRGLDARKHLDMQKRDSHGDHIKLNIPDHIKAAARPADAAQMDYIVPNKAAADEVTLTSVVYKTLSATFDGPVAGYTTLSQPDPSPTDVAQSGAANAQTEAAAPTAASSNQASTKAAAPATSSTIATSVATLSPSSSAASSTDDGSNNKSRFLNPGPSAAAATTASASLTAAAIGGTPLSQTRTNVVAGVAGTPISATREAQIGNQSSGMSAGGKAGLAFGIIIALGLVAGLLFFCWRRRRNPNANQEIKNEKRASDSSSFFGGRAMSEKHASVSSQQSTRTAATAPRLSLRPVTQFLPNLGNNRQSNANHLDVAGAMSEKPKSMWERRSHNAQNPFEDANQLSEKQARPETPPANPFDEPEDEKAGEKSPSAKSAQIATASAVAVTSGTANSVQPPRAAQNNVHRVQLDFKPSMDDELELKSGQLVRMVHEYDDGWALCMRMDRSQQGVVPRTCLSKLPVKPRPQGPPPMGPNGRPMSPGMAPRPLTPTGRERSGSNAERPMTPTGGSGMPARKPVPGQAI